MLAISCANDSSSVPPSPRTVSTTSASRSSAARSSMTAAPRDRYAASSAKDRTPASHSTATAKPSLTSWATASGTSAARASRGRCSRGTASRRLMDGGAPAAAVGRVRRSPRSLNAKPATPILASMGHCVCNRRQASLGPRFERTVRALPNATQRLPPRDVQISTRTVQRAALCRIVSASASVESGRYSMLMRAVRPPSTKSTAPLT